MPPKKKGQGRLLKTRGVRFDVDLPTRVAKPMPKTIPSTGLTTNDTDEMQPNLSLTLKDMQDIVNDEPQTAAASNTVDQLHKQVASSCEGQRATWASWTLSKLRAFAAWLVGFVRFSEVR